MKNAKPSLIFILVITFCISCEKQPDFRDKYLGSWKFDVSESHETFNVTQWFHDTTTLITYHGVLKYGSTHSSIIFLTNGYSGEYYIDKDGKIVAVKVFGPNYSESGGFEGRNVFKYSYYHHWGGSQKYVATNIEGVRE
jgi:hypothetical protein